MFIIGLIISTSIIIPLVLIIVLALTNKLNFKNQEDLQISFMIFGLGVMVNLALSAIGYRFGTSHAYFNEIWNFKGVAIEHQMKWTTHETRTYQEAAGQEACGTDSNGRTIYRTKYVTKVKHYTETHGPYWFLTNEYGSESNISENEYNKWKDIWKNEKQTGIHNGSSAFGDRSIDGPIFECQWTGDFNTIYPISTIHTYLNKVRASKTTIMKFKEPSEELKKKFVRPADERNISPLINYGSNISIDENDVLLLQRTNASLGVNYKVHSIFIFFNAKEYDMNVISDVLSAWQGVNKNELVTFIGIDKETKRMSWVKTESWMDDTTIHGYIADYLLGKEYSSGILSEALLKYVPKYWHKKDFRDFDYLTISISPWVVVGVIFFQMIGVVVIFFIIDAQYSGKCTSPSYNFRKYNY